MNEGCARSSNTHHFVTRIGKGVISSLAHW